MLLVRLNPTRLILACILIGALVAIIGSLGGSGSGGALLLSLVFWVSVVEGCVALVAGAELSNAKWILPLKRGLLSVYPLLLFFAFLFLLIWPQMDLYSWTKEPGLWLNKGFFVTRSFVLLLLAFFVARMFARESLAGGSKKNLFAVIYLLVFVTSQSLIAFDWIMSLEQPWFSTLFGGYFFVEAFYAAIAISIIIYIFYARKAAGSEETLRDAAKMLFGFSLLWAGLFYAQYLVIWYGHLPEETGYLIKRIFPPYAFISKVILALLFILPFIGLLSRKLKTVPVVTGVLSLCVLVGIFLERFLFIVPVVEMNIAIIVVEFLALAILFFATIGSEDLLLPALPDGGAVWRPAKSSGMPKLHN